MASNVIKRIKEGIPAPHLKAKGADDVDPADMWLDNDDIRPLKLQDRTWNLWTYLTFWFSAGKRFASSTIRGYVTDRKISRNCFQLVCCIECAGFGSQYVGVCWRYVWWSILDCYCHCPQRQSWRQISHWLPGSQQSLLRRVRCLVAYFQPCGYGMCLEWSQCRSGRPVHLRYASCTYT